MYYEDDFADVRLEEVEPGFWTVFSMDGNSTYYCSNSQLDCKYWCEDNDMSIGMILSFNNR